MRPRPPCTALGRCSSWDVRAREPPWCARCSTPIRTSAVVPRRFSCATSRTWNAKTFTWASSSSPTRSGTANCATSSCGCTSSVPRSSGRRARVDKSPGYAMIPNFLDSLFPDCQIVHVIRDPHDVLDSWRRRWGFRRAVRGVEAWAHHVRRARKFGAAHPDRYFEIRYEEMVRSPERIIRELIEWMDEPWDDRVLQFKQLPPMGRRPEEERTKPADRSPGADERPSNRAGVAATKTPPTEAPLDAKVFSSSVGAGRWQPPNLALAVLLRFSCGPLVRELGYR